MIELAHRSRRQPLVAALIACIALGASASAAVGREPDTRPWSVARQCNEEVLGAMRSDYARPTVHARNLFHVSAAM